MKVKIIPIDVYHKLYDITGVNKVYIHPKMLTFCGKEANITENDSLGLYILDIDGGVFRWPKGMFDTKMRFIDESKDNS